MAYNRPVNSEQITDDTVSNVDLAEMAEGTIKGRVATGTGDPEDLTGDEVRSIINWVQTVTTTDATQTTLTSSKSIASNSVQSFITRITAIEGTTGDVWIHEIRGSIKNLSSVTSLVDDNTDELISEDTGAINWSVSIEANDSTDSLDIKVTGEVSHTIKWHVETVFNELIF